jgi:hypothetical protein
MKTIGIKMIVGCISLASIAMNSFGQDTMTTTKKGGKKTAKVMKVKVPKVVTDLYIVEYPSTTSETWYGYSSLDESDLFGYDTTLYIVGKPEYYVVEFTKEETPHKAIYSKSGKKIATSNRLKGNLPKAISDALANGAYKDWTVKAEKEEMRRDSDKKKVYKVVVEKGKEKHALFYELDGKLVKDRKIKI